MPSFAPFLGLRYSHSHIRSLSDVVCPPYDVISESEREALEARSPSNIVRLELPRDDGDRDIDRYESARRLLDAWRDGGILHRDQEPAFYGYSMSFADSTGVWRRTVGVIGALGLEAPGQGILPHEETTPKAKSDRLELLRATRANLSPIWGLATGPGLTENLRPPAHPADRAVDDDRVIHELWTITDRDEVGAIRAAIQSAPVLIADGHHRYETAVTYRGQQRSGTAMGDDGYVMALVVELNDQQLTVQAIHRLITGLPDGFDLAAALGAWFDVTPTGPADRSLLTRMAEAGALGVLTPTGAWLARPRDELVTGPETRNLDSIRLDAALRLLPPHQLAFQHGWDDCAAAVATGQVDGAVLLRPATIAQIAEIGRGGVRMPPKTTYFWPKPRTGMVVRELLA